MENEFVKPQEAVSRLLRRHYPGGRKAKSGETAARMPLISALRSGMVEWRCAKWRETFFDEDEQVFDDATVAVQPDEGWSCDFWQAALAADHGYWQSNTFIAYGSVTPLDAPRKVSRWLRQNGGGNATWQRTAEGVEVNWIQVIDLLGKAGWQAWSSRASDPQPTGLLSKPYRAAMMKLVALALSSPRRFETESLYSLVFDAFDDRETDPPSDADMRRIAAELRKAIGLWGEALPSS